MQGSFLTRVVRFAVVADAAVVAVELLHLGAGSVRDVGWSLHVLHDQHLRSRHLPQDRLDGGVYAFGVRVCVCVCVWRCACVRVLGVCMFPASSSIYLMAVCVCVGGGNVCVRVLHACQMRCVCVCVCVWCARMSDVWVYVRGM